MIESAQRFAFAKAVMVVALGGLFVKAALDASRVELMVAARSPKNASARGEFGGDLDFLKRYRVAPRSPSESNYYFDLWSPGELPALARANGLTNNRALFIDSHGGSGFRWHGLGYGLYPRDTLLGPQERTPCFSARDVAAVIGKEGVAGIHNIIVAGCNEEGRFRSREWRRHFPHATNIIYMTPGKLAFKPMFYQAIVTPSAEIKPFYGKLRRLADRIDAEIGDTPSAQAEALGVYVADLFLPGARKPYRRQQAGRELLDPPNRLATLARADASLAARP